MIPDRIWLGAVDGNWDNASWTDEPQNQEWLDRQNAEVVEYHRAPEWVAVSELDKYDLEDGWYWLKDEDGTEWIDHFSPIYPDKFGGMTITHFCFIPPLPPAPEGNDE